MNDTPTISPTSVGVPANVKYLTETQLATRWNVSRKYLQKARYERTGVPPVRLGRRAIRYAIEEVVAYEEACRRASVEEEG